LLTSGSSGPPKWAIHRHSDIPACIATYGRHVLALSPDDVTWSVAPLASSYGLGNTLYFPFGAGASTWVTGAPPSPDEVARACTEGGATALFGVPTFWARVARHVADGRVPASVFADVRLAVSAGEPLPAAVWQQVHDVLGLALVDGLGSSEATNLYVSTRRNRTRADSLGWVVPGYELRVVDPSGQPVADGTPGELLVRGATIMTGYLDAPEATERTLRDSWLHTGDRVVRQPDASYRFVGRVGERFKSGGLWVDPVQIEAVLSGHPGVAEVAVTSVPDVAEIRRVAAVVVARDRFEPGQLRRELDELSASLLAAHEIPREYRFVAQLPTAASGKVRRGELQRLVESQPVEAVIA
jgi:acyl-coenzyme A synthetase/AMP-(fatty) acid ligase